MSLESFCTANRLSALITLKKWSIFRIFRALFVWFVCIVLAKHQFASRPIDSYFAKICTTHCNTSTSRVCFCSIFKSLFYRFVNGFFCVCIGNNVCSVHCCHFSHVVLLPFGFLVFGWCAPFSMFSFLFRFSCIELNKCNQWQIFRSANFLK